MGYYTGELEAEELEELREEEEDLRFEINRDNEMERRYAEQLFVGS